MKKMAVIAVAVLVLIIGVFMLTSQSAKSPEPTAESVAEPLVNVENSSESTIIYTDNGFESADLTVKSGTILEVKNISSKSLQFSSDDHPTHTKNSELNLKVLSPGKSETFKVSKKGTFGYHDHLNKDHTGNLTVE